MEKRPTLRYRIHIALFLTILCLTLGVFPSPARCQDLYQIAILPEYQPIVIYEKYTPLLKTLQEELGVEFQLIIPNDFDEYFQIIRDGSVDFSYQNPYVFLELWPHLQPLVITEKGKKWGIEGRGLIVARANGGINKPDDIVGKRISIVSFHSANGYMAQKNLLKGMMIYENTDYNVFETYGNFHQNVVADVLNEKADAGFIGEEILRDPGTNSNISTEEFENLTIIARTSYIPNWIFGAKKGLKRRFVQKVQNVLLDIPLGSDALKAAGIRSFLEIPSNYLEEYRSKNP